MELLCVGGGVGVGSYGEIEGLGMYFEVWVFVVGMMLFEVLCVVMIEGVKVFGFECDFGSFEVGKFVDFVVLCENLFDDIIYLMLIEWVMKGGVFYDVEMLEEC